MKKPIIEFKNVSKVFEDNNTVVLKDINFELEEGKFYTLLGASGSGKSTILNIIAGLLDASTGDVFLDGVRINDVPTNKRDVHTVFQSYALFPHMSVYDNIAFSLKLKKLPKDEIDKKVRHYVHLVQLDDHIHKKPNQLSGGQQQRVSIARALMNGGEIILADEPTGALDSHSGENVMEILRQLHEEGHTIIMVTHDKHIAASANRIIEIKDGEIISDTQKRQVKSAVKNPSVFHWKNATVYFVLTDRFHNGNPHNDHSYGRQKDGMQENT